jgi:hypothetical protein
MQDCQPPTARALVYARENGLPQGKCIFIMAIAILGMHRSGTSMVAGLLKLCGLALGDDEDLVPATDDNRKGHWEHKEFVRLNTAMLALAGGAAEDPPMLPEGWFEQIELEPLRDQAKRSVVRIFGERTDWGWKDPRTALTVPFWRTVVPGLRFVICIRNPLDSAASLAKRNQVTQRKAMALWQHYNEAALRNTRPEERIVVFYEDFFQDVRRALMPLLDYLDLPHPPEGSHQEHAIREFVDAGLRHHRHTLDDVVESPDAFIVTKLLYCGLRLHPDEIDTIFRAPAPDEHTVRGWGTQEHAIIEAQTAYVAQRAREIADLRTWTAKQHEALEWHASQAAEHEKEITAVRAWAAEQRGTIAAQVLQIAGLGQELADLQRWATQQNETIASQNAEIAKLQDWANELQRGLAWRAEQVSGLESELAATRKSVTK